MCRPVTSPSCLPGDGQSTTPSFTHLAQNDAATSDVAATQIRVISALRYKPPALISAQIKGICLQDHWFLTKPVHRPTLVQFKNCLLAQSYQNSFYVEF